MKSSTSGEASSQFVSEENRHNTRNFLILTCHHILLRCGWIFKTESLIMPAVADTLGAGAWLRGCLPLLNRFGQSIPPILMSRRIKITPQKKWAVLLCAISMSLCFLTLAVLWQVANGQTHWWMAPAFLAIYGAFFVSTGIYSMTFNTLQGKVIPANRRGRLSLASNILGAVLAIVAAGTLLPFWLRTDGEEFRYIFGFAGVMFALAAVLAMFLVEPVDSYEQSPRRPIQLLRDAARTLRDDVHFRRLAIIGALFGTSITLFPHYQAIGRLGYQDLKLTVLISWVIVQNAGTAFFSLITGPLADRFGNRLALRVVLLLLCMVPAWALILAHYGATWRWCNNFVFFLVGVTPVVFRIVNNYTLELAKPEDHPRYLSTLSLCIAVPALLSPLCGWLVDVTGFTPVFLVIGSLIFVGWLLTFSAHEPRYEAK